ncbi:MAG: adenosylcobinamide-GDP ribazoletransferase [Methanotrichaceae archaeon]|nr:adenosylcobinamide-GDP ribazoletransferase [Methanotrichaceae archaeon]MDD1758641.1 adenosylcobinamide-GDP ribazoletransferase [Methanotrichaceae archaeon]
MEGIETLMRYIYVFPLIGLVLGGIFGFAAFMASQILTANLVAILIIIMIYALCGINHIDGLADFGDGIIAHGPVDNKIKAMKDVSLGTGGVVFIIIIILAYFAIISDMLSWLLPLALIVSEVSAKQSMVAFAAFSKSLQKGFGQIMIEKTNMREFLIGLIIASLFCSVILGPLGLVALVSSQVAAFYLVRVANRNFGGSTGDGIGATNEISRAVALVICMTMVGVVPWTFW